MMPRKYETIVGIFVLASLAALAVLIFVIAQQEGLWQEKVEYHTVFRNVAGLKKGDEVRLSGVAVGNVDDISINRQGNIIVSFSVEKKYADRIRENSVASIGFKSMLGEKSLDVTAGKPESPAVPADGLVASVEPLDVTELLAKAGPSLESLQTVLGNLATLTASMRNPNSDFYKTLEEVKQIVNKIDQGKGSLGLLINDPKLYQETTQTMAAIKNITRDLEQGKGLLGTLIIDQKFKSQTQETMTNLHTTISGLSKTATHLEKRLPELTQKSGTFFENLSKAAQGLPGLVTSSENFVSDADNVAKAAQKSWFLRSYVPQPREHTIRVEREAGKD
jgi:phospholipid/cholesterol/gamma-HCH transport system substrate-binding protein